MQSANSTLETLGADLAAAFAEEGRTEARLVVPGAAVNHPDVEKALKKHRLGVELLAQGEFGAELKFFKV